jgi:hypothetical protein
MRKLTRINLDDLAVTMQVMSEDKQRRYVGGADSDFYYGYTGTVYSTNAYNALVASGAWSGGVVEGMGYVMEDVVITGSPSSYYSNALMYEGVPYLYGGMDSSGMDCSALVNLATGYSTRVWGTSMGAPPGSWETIAAQSISGLLEGDLLVWNGHVAFYAGGGRLFHAHGAQGTPAGYTNDLSWYINTKGFPTVYRQK